MRHLVMAVACSLGLGACIPYPTIERRPEPVYFLLNATAPDAYTRAEAYKTLSDPQSPWFNLRAADDYWLESAEWSGFPASFVPAPAWLTGDEKRYWIGRELVRGGWDYLLNNQNITLFGDDYAKCVWWARAGRSPAGNSASWEGCKALPDEARTRAMAEGRQWREAWRRPDAAFACLSVLRAQTLSQLRVAQEKSCYLPSCGQVKDWNEVVRLAERRLGQWGQP